MPKSFNYKNIKKNMQSVNNAKKQDLLHYALKLKITFFEK